MNQFGWANCFDAVRTQVNTFLDALRAILGDKLVGIYLHGSNEGSILSKDEGGEWALRTLPEELCGIVAQALNIYRGDRKVELFDEVTLTGFARFMDERIKGQHVP